MTHRTITTRPTPQGNTQVIITQGGLDFVNIKGTTTVNIYSENSFLNDGKVLQCANLGSENASFKRWVTFWLKENQD